MKRIKPIWIVALVAVAVVVLVATGVIHPPNLEQLILDTGEALGPYAYVLVGVMAFLETGAFVGLIAPGEFTILVGGVIAGQGEIDVLALIAVVWFCAVAGDLTSYFLGRRLGRGFLERNGPKVKITHERLEQVEGFFDRHGGKAILIGRFVGLVRAIAPFLAGSSRMPLRRFIPYDVVGAGIWGTTFVVLGFVFWRSFDRVAEIAKKGALALGFAIALGFALFAAIRWLRQDANRARMREYIERRWLLRPLLPAARVAAPPARFAWNRLTPGDLGLELTTLLATGGVGLFVFVGYWHVLDERRFTVGDLKALHWADDLRDAAAVDILKILTALGSLPVTGGLVLLAAALLVVRRQVAMAAALVAGMGLTVWAVHLAKDWVDRPRPLASLVSTMDQSYPSGHSAYAVAYVAVAVAIARSRPGWGGRVVVLSAAIGLLVLIGLSRIYLRAHFLSDVLGGVGLAVALFSLTGIVALVVTYLRQNARTA